MGLTFADLFDLTKTEQFLNAVTNNGGGVIVIGTRKASSGLIAEGINFETMEEVLEKEGQVKEILQKIKPPCNF